MNYYEELGIRSDADEEEIRKAHRRLVKLMHPDQHRDAGLKALAETQMRRLNSIVATLLDPEERRDYDEQLRGGGVPEGAAAPAARRQSPWHAVPWWIASTVGAIVLTVATVWFIADRMGSFRAHPVPPSEITAIPPSADPAPAPAQQASPSPQPEDKTVIAVPTRPAATTPTKEAKALDPPKPVSTPPLGPPSGATAEAAAAQTAARPGPKKIFPGVSPPIIPVAHNETLVAASNPPAPIVSAGGPDIPRTDYNPPPPPRARPAKHDLLEGEWVYAPTEPERRKAGLYPPEFIQLKLVRDTNGIHGVYTARYDVDKSVSPDVSFSVKSTDPRAMKYNWTAANGAHGWLEIKDLESDTMRLEWRDTSKFTSGAEKHLSSGVATLVRKN